MGKLLNLEDNLFTENRIFLYGCGGIVVFFFAMYWIVFVEGPWVFYPDGLPRCIDFGFFWLSGKLALAGDTARIFDFPAWSAVQEAFFRPGNCPNFNRFYYPPTLLFFTYPLGLMPYAFALGVWIIGLFTFFLATVYTIIPRHAALIAAVTPMVMLSNTLLGHTGYLTAALFGLSLVFMERRPWLSGIFLGLLTYKPQFGLLFPIALLASRNWRVIGTTAVTTIILGILASAAFGFDGWVQFIDSLSERTSGLGPAQGVEPRLQSIFGLAVHLFGASFQVSWIAQSIVAIMTTFGIWVLWSKPVSHNLKAAGLCAAIFLVSPYALFYDLTILSIAAAFFVKEGLSRGFLPGERIAILLCWFSLLPLGWRSGPVISAVLLLLIARRIAVHYTARQEVAQVVFVG